MDLEERPLTTREKLDSLGEQYILEQIMGAKSILEFAKEHKLPYGSVWNWLFLHDADRSVRAKYAMTASAESWTDRGLQALQEAPADQAEIARARAIEQHCARRAAIRNPQYRDKADIDISGQVQHVTAIRRLVIEPVAPPVLEVEDAVPRLPDES